MVRALTEVVTEIRLPPGPMARLLTDAPRGVIVLTPLAQNGTGYPERFLLTAAHLDAKRQAIVDALSAWFDPLDVTGEDDGAVHLIGALNDVARRLLDGVAGEALGGRPHALVHRPVLLKDRSCYVSFIRVDGQPVEDAMQRLTSLLKERGLTARLVRLGPYRPEAQALAAYDETLTPKQAEILKVALALGLYDTPRRCTLDDLAELFGISKAAAHNRMKGAERKVLARYFD